MSTAKLSEVYKGFTWAKEPSNCCFVCISKRKFRANNEKSEYCRRLLKIYRLFHQPLTSQDIAFLVTRENAFTK